MLTQGQFQQFSADQHRSLHTEQCRGWERRAGRSFEGGKRMFIKSVGEGRMRKIGLGGDGVGGCISAIS